MEQPPAAAGATCGVGGQTHSVAATVSVSFSSSGLPPPNQLRAPPDQLLGLLLGLQDRGEPRPPPPVRSSWSRPPAPHAARGSSRHTLTHVHVAATREPLLALATEKQWRRGALPGASLRHEFTGMPVARRCPKHPFFCALCPLLRRDRCRQRTVSNFASPADDVLSLFRMDPVAGKSIAQLHKLGRSTTCAHLWLPHHHWPAMATHTQS